VLLNEAIICGFKMHFGVGLAAGRVPVLVKVKAFIKKKYTVVRYAEPELGSLKKNGFPATLNFGM
jgi:hypothetical protein